MKIFDCIMYFDEEILLDLRMNILDKYVDYFVIVESTFTHKGEERKLHFNHKRFEKFENKIIYLVYDEKPKDIKEILKNDIEPDISNKFIINALLRENGQRNFIINGLKDADDDDYILVSDVDEIPNLEEVDFSKINQKIFFTRFLIELMSWIGTCLSTCLNIVFMLSIFGSNCLYLNRGLSHIISPVKRDNRLTSKSKFIS